MTMEPISTVAIRIRFSGSQESDTFHMTPSECNRFLSDWKMYLSGGNAVGGEYFCEESDRAHVILLNFHLIAYTEPGKVY